MSLESSSSFSRYGHRDERRRRLLTDDLGDTVTGTAWRSASNEAAATKLEHYGDADFLNHQLRVSDLIPRTLVGQLLLLAAGVFAIICLEVGYVWMCDRAAEGNALVTSLDVNAKGSLACWFMSLLLTAAAVNSLIVYSVRRYRIDDYQGRYRVWGWAAGLWFFAAADQAGSLHQWFQHAMISATGTTLVGDGDAWWIAVYAVLIGAIGSRMFLDMRPSWLSTSFLAAAGIATVGAFSTRWHWIFSQRTVASTVWESSGEIAACLLLLFAISFYARHVLLEAEGRLPVRAAKPKKAKMPKAAKAESKQSSETPAAASTGDMWRKIDPPQATPPQPHQAVTQTLQTSSTVSAASVQKTTVAAASAASIASSIGSTDHKLSKAERKALKERLLRERRERDAKK